MLLVNNYEREIRKLRIISQNRVRANHDVNLARSNLFFKLCLVLSRGGKQRHLYAEFT